MGQIRSKSNQVKINHRLKNRSSRSFGDNMSLNVYNMLIEKDINGISF